MLQKSFPLKERSMKNVPSFSNSTEFDVIVVGAGAAGLAAAKSLVAAGKSVICFEAADRIGGRAHTDTQIFGVPFDIGAHWLHVEHLNPFIKIAKSLGFDVAPQKDNYLTYGDPDDLLWAEVEEIEDQMAEAAEADHDVSMLDVFQSKSPWSHTAAMMHALSMGRDMAEISVQDWDLEVEGSDWLCVQGFGAIVARHAGDLPVSLETSVSAISRTAKGVTVETSKGTAKAKAVIVTVSQGVLAAETIRFDPPLENERLGAIAGITMGTYNHIALKFAPDALPIQPDTWVTYQLGAQPDSILRGGGFLCNASNHGLTSFENSGTFAQELEEAGQDEAISFALNKLIEIFGSDIRKGFEGGHAMQWGKNPMTLGSYSGALPGSAGLRKHLGRAHAERIHFAGEATHLVEMATVSGAHKEGLCAAQDVLSQLN